MDSEELAKLKVELEVEKLKRETGRWGWLELKLQTKDIFNILIAIGGLWLAWHSGLFDAKKTQLDAQNLMLEAKNERFKTEALLAGERNRRIEEQSTILAADLKQLQSEVDRYRLTESGLQYLRKTGDVAIRYDLMDNLFAFHIERDIGIPGFYSGGRSYVKLTKRIENIAEILSQIHRLKLPAPVEIVEVCNTPLTGEDLERVGAMNVEWLLLENTESTDESLRSLESLVGLTALTLTDQALGKLDSLSRLPNLNRLFLSNVGIESGAFDLPMKCSQKLEWFVINEKHFGDRDVEWLYQFTKLRKLTLNGTKVSTMGLRKIAEHLDTSIEFSPAYEGSEAEYTSYVEEMNAQIVQIKSIRGDLKNRKISFTPIRFDWGSIYAP